MLHPPAQQLLLQPPHLHVGLDCIQFPFLQLRLHVADLHKKILITGEFFLHMGKHLELDVLLLVKRRLHHLRHVLCHVRLHLQGHFLLELKLVELVTSCLRQDFLPQLLLQLKHLDHPWLISLHHLHYLGSSFVEWDLRNEVYDGLIPIDFIAATLLDRR